MDKSRLRNLVGLLFVFTLMSATIGCEETYDSMEVLQIFPERVWFKVSHNAVPAGPMAESELKSTSFYVWEKTGQLVKVDEAGEGCIYYGSPGCVISPDGGLLWIPREDGMLRVWERESEKSSLVCDRVTRGGLLVSEDGRRLWFHRRNEANSWTDLCTWRMGDDEPTLVAVGGADSMWLIDGQDRIYYSRNASSLEGERTLRTYTLGSDKPVFIAPLLQGVPKACADDERIWFHTDEGLRVWDAFEGEVLNVSQEVEGTSLVVSADCDRVFFVQDSGAGPVPATWSFNDRTVTGAPLVVEPADSLDLSLMRVSEKGALLFFTAQDGDFDPGLFAWRLSDGFLSQVCAGVFSETLQFSDAGGRVWFLREGDEGEGSEKLATWSIEGGLVEIAQSPARFGGLHARGDKILFNSREPEQGPSAGARYSLFRWSVADPQLVKLDSPVEGLSPTPDGSRVYLYRLPENPVLTEGTGLYDRQILEIRVEDETKAQVGVGWLSERLYKPISDYGIVYENDDSPKRSSFFWQDGESSLIGRW